MQEQERHRMKDTLLTTGYVFTMTTALVAGGMYLAGNIVGLVQLFTAGVI